MSSIDVIKENIQFQQLLKENNSSTVLKNEYVIPDTHPDVYELLCVEGKAIINNKEISVDRVTIEGRVEYNVLYIPREDTSIINSVSYYEDFNSYLNVEEEEHKVICEVGCKIEHIDAKIMNERKISIEGAVNVEWEVYRGIDFDYVKDIEGGSKQVEVLKNTESISRLTVSKDLDMIGKSMIRISMDKPQIDKILMSTMTLHKKEIKITEDKAYLGCYCKINIMYLGMDSQDVVCIEDDVYISKEEEIVGITSDMTPAVVYEIQNSDLELEDGDLGEVRIINTEFLIKANVKVFSSQNISVIKDAYSPIFDLELKKNEYEIGVVHGVQTTENIIRDSITFKEGDLRPSEIISVSARSIIGDKNILDNKISISGSVKVNIIYKTMDEEIGFKDISADIPFTIINDMLGVKEGMKAIVKCDVESIEANLEANTIAIKTTLSNCIKVCYELNKEFISDAIEGEEDKEGKKASIIIYVVNKGDTLWSLAKKYKTTIDELVRINSLENADEIAEGEKLMIPGRATF